MKYLKFIFLIPALPFMLLFAFYLIYKVFKHSGLVETQMWLIFRREGEWTPEMKEWIDKFADATRIPLRIFSALVWITIILHII